MNWLRLAIPSLLALWSIGAMAADLTLDDQDCAKILERWAENPNSVPRHLVDACKEQMAVAPAPETVAAQPAPVDPCAGPDAAGSVLCWGPWATLAPAAAGPVAALEFPDFPGDCETGADISNQCVARLALLTPPDPPLDGCTPGTSCGFATVVDNLTSTGDVEATGFRKFDMATDGTNFTVDPAGTDEIQSIAMDATVFPGFNGWEELDSRGRDGTDESYLIARVIREDDEGDIQMAADIWTRASTANSSLNRSGYFAWGVATSQSGLNFLNGNGIRVAFSGPMSVNNATNATMTVDFGSQPSWTGNWTNPAWSFGAGGAVTGVNLISSPDQFTSNVQAGGLVQGALVGEPGRQGLIHLIDVTLAGQGHIKDVGLLREIVGGSTPTATGVSP